MQASPRDCGLYQCVISNEFGTDATDFLLSPEGEEPSAAWQPSQLPRGAVGQRGDPRTLRHATSARCLCLHVRIYTILHVCHSRHPPRRIVGSLGSVWGRMESWQHLDVSLLPVSSSAVGIYPAGGD